MCDYSLAGSANRLAENGDQLMVHRFPTGSLGLVSARRRVREILFPSLTVAVCVPPGARLLLLDIPQRLQQELEASSTEIVTFTQRTWEAHVHRDSVQFSNGRKVSLQQLHCGQRVTVLSLGCDDTARAEPPCEDLAIWERRSRR
jgi:hypothetical protein